MLGAFRRGAKFKRPTSRAQDSAACILSNATCYIPGIQVVSATGLKNIKDIKVGDFVKSNVPNSDKTDYKSVLNTFIIRHTELYVLMSTDPKGDA
jgi:hypothetical protein